MIRSITWHDKGLKSTATKLSPPKLFFFFILFLPLLAEIFTDQKQGLYSISIS